MTEIGSRGKIGTGHGKLGFRIACVISEAGMTVEKYDEESEQWEKLLREIERK